VVKVKAISPEDESWTVQGDWYVISGKKLQELAEKGIELKLYTE